MAGLRRSRKLDNAFIVIADMNCEEIGFQRDLDFLRKKKLIML